MSCAVFMNTMFIRYNRLWNWIDIFFSIEFGMLYGPRALLLPRFLRHRSYIFLSNV